MSAAVARLVLAGVDPELEADLDQRGLRLVTVEPVDDDHVRARLDHGAYRVSITFVLRGHGERDAEAVLDVLRRPPDTWDARWAGTTEDTKDVRPAIAGARWRMEVA